MSGAEGSEVILVGAEGSEVILLRACPDRCRYRSWRCFADVTVPEPVDSCVYPPFSVKSTPDSRHGIRTRSFGFSIIWIQYERTGLHMYVHARFHAKRPPRRTRQAHTGSDSHYREEIAQGKNQTGVRSRGDRCSRLISVRATGTRPQDQSASRSRRRSNSSRSNERL